MNYKTIDQNDLTVLQTIVPSERLFVGSAIDHDMAHDELGTVSNPPEVHIKVIDKDEIIAIMKYAHNNYIPVTVRGSGTGLVGACVPLYGGILLDTSLMNIIIELDEINMTLRV